eukprot:CAMPEP_0183379454 /NCGR_PEP_ID=MMETSP0164_2-20130417/125436_1 /TAXON_ID=221442 /ORGANISM="Coccolithus pelagicus ssp braarudi, Strain PLY182g" /LENGTH=40 /DNA_ID= /DNA_START= /DNA_END= /DNA_ORIENTATION=
MKASNPPGILLQNADDGALLDDSDSPTSRGTPACPDPGHA